MAKREPIVCCHCGHFQSLLGISARKTHNEPVNYDYVGRLSEKNWFTVMDTCPKWMANVSEPWFSNVQNSKKRFYCSPTCWLYSNCDWRVNRRDAKRIVEQWFQTHPVHSTLLRIEEARIYAIFHPH